MDTNTVERSTDSPAKDAACSVADALKAMNGLEGGYRHDGDWMICKCCNSRIVASRWDERFEHAKGCERGNDPNPWRTLWECLRVLVLKGRRQPQRRTDAYFVAEDNSQPSQLWVWYGFRDESAEPICRVRY